jgi:SOS-response transcriptional repressor LexA
MKEATDRQLEVLEYMRTYQRTNGMPPTVREIADARRRLNECDHVHAARSRAQRARVSPADDLARLDAEEADRDRRGIVYD